jgi:sporadic carbohydrate cluster 2OG-Fe(II) oxygenase
MLEKYYTKLSDNGKKLIDNGYFIIEVEKPSKLDSIKQSFINYLSQEHSIDISIENLQLLHKELPFEMINDVRVGFYQFINKSISNFAFEYLELASASMFDVVGTELASNKMVNFSIQLPGDESSVLPIHADDFSGESHFQLNLWVPLVNAYGTNSMFIANPEFSQEILSNIRRYEEKGINHLLDKHPNEFQFLELSYGQALIFTPTCLHGNVVNRTEHSRLSFNCRFKNLYSPYNESEESSKKLGSFYEPITPKAASLIGLNFEIEK